MSAADLPRAVLDNQIAASNPGTSAWVSANAGSGKTHVLVQRVIRLLLDGVDPAKILCLTFTKAAAANMANRVFETLAEWTALDDSALDKEIAKIEGRRPSAERRRGARRLFAEALETPGGLKVQTIHAFCTALLHQFPFEADVAASFEVLEERAERELIDRMRLEVLLEAAGAPDTPLGRALATAIVNAADVTFADVVRDAVAQRHALEAWLGRAGGVTEALDELAQRLGVAPGDTLAQLQAEILESPVLPPSEWPALARALSEGLASDRKSAERLAVAQGGRDWTPHVEAYVDIFCTGDLEPRKSVATQTIKREHPALYARLLQEQERVCALIEKRRAIVLRDRSAALVTVAAEVLRRYRAEKARRGLLDYDDLIERTLKLFDNVAAAWVLYKLDRGIDHVLIDEAQDTSPQQWEVIRKLTAEFFAGEGARSGVRRSIFAVGDEKQSIYSFQGAAPDRFDEMRRHFETAHRASGHAFERVEFQYSFRSAPDILDAVDTVFSREAVYKGLTAEEVKTAHAAVRHNAPGLVEVWPLAVPDPKQQVEPWNAPFDAVTENSPPAQLARRIARAVQCWIARGDLVGDGEKRRAVRPGDILILVRQRGPLFEAIIRALKDLDVAVAGADRLLLLEHIAVMDLMSLADALLLPHDDLALAEALKSPLFGFDDAQLFTLAYERKGSLRGALRARAADDPAFTAAVAELDRLGRAARRQTPFAFFAGLLGVGGARKRMLARLGPEASDALDEFLALALDYESRHTPSLQGFVAWLRAADAQVKRDMDIVRDEVRVMTVHGAKGLEAPIVVLAETTTKPTGPRDPPLLALGPAEGAPLVWARGSKTDTPPVALARAAARTAADNEHRRLLYVAMTRAADRLVVCGSRGPRQQPEGCWHDLVHAALAGDGGAVEVPAEDGDGTVWRWRKSTPEEPPAQRTLALGEVAASAPPAWLARMAPEAPRLAAALVPSQAAQGAWRPAAAEGPARDALARGLVVHRLLQALPNVPAERRADAAWRYLARNARSIAPADAAEGILAQVEAVLGHPAFAPLFAEGSRAEVPIAGRVARTDGSLAPVSGQIDRLAVTAESVLIADFKTDRDPPRRWEDVPRPYTTQLALYRAVVSALYPGREVRAALVFTESGALVELPSHALDAALTHIGVSAP